MNKNLNNLNNPNSEFVPTLSPSGPPQNEPKGGHKILSSEFRERFITTVPTCPPLKDNLLAIERAGNDKRGIGIKKTYRETFEIKGGQGDRGTESETPLDNVLDIEFEKWLDLKKTLRRDYLMNGQRFRDCVVYVLCSLNIEPTFGNFRKYDPVMDWEAITMQDLRNKGIVE